MSDASKLDVDAGSERLVTSVAKCQSKPVFPRRKATPLVFAEGNLKSSWVNHISGALLSTYCIFGCLAYYIPDGGSQYVCNAIGVLIWVIALRKGDRLAVVGFLIALFVSLWMLVCLHLNGEGFRWRFIFVIANAAVACLLLRRNIAPLWGFLPYALVTCFYVLCFVKGIDPDKISEVTSQNGISLNVLWSGSVFLLLREKQRKLWNSVFAIPIVVITILAHGRSGVLSATILMILLIVSEARHFRELGSWRHAWVIVCCTLALAGIARWSFLLGTEIVWRFQELGYTDRTRALIIEEYMQRLEWRGILVGLMPSESDTMTRVHDDPHNSYIRAHMYFGVLAVPLFLLIALAGVKSLWRPTVSGACLIALAVRVSTDSVAFVGYFDFLIVYTVVNVLYGYAGSMHQGWSSAARGWAIRP